MTRALRYAIGVSLIIAGGLVEALKTVDSWLTGWEAE